MSSMRSTGKANRLFPGNLANQNVVQRVYKAHYRGRPNAEIARRLKVSDDSVRVWLRDEKWYYPWTDHVVIERALVGDREAFDVMTAWERQAFLDVLVKWRKRELHDFPETRFGGNEYESVIYVLGLALGIPNLTKSVGQRIIRLNRKAKEAA